VQPGGEEPAGEEPEAAQTHPSTPPPTDWLAPAEPPVAEPPPVASPLADRLPADEPLAVEPPPTDWLAPAEPPVAEPPPVASPLAPSPVAPPPFLASPLADELPADEPLEEAEPKEAERPKTPLSERLKRTPPALVILTLAAIGSSGFVVYELSTRTAPIPVLTSASVVTGFVYVTVAVVCAIATYRAAIAGRAWQSYLLAFIGGMAAIIAAGAFAGALILFLALGF
jgi:hypothetical protein